VLAHACGCFGALAAERGITYEVSLPAELLAEVDVGKTELALGNALFNAFKYVPERGVVRCTVTVDELLQDVVIGIEDSGPSVHPAQLDAIFDRGRVAERSVAIQLDAVRLSLGLSRDVVSLHGGVLDTVPTRSGHALFEIRLPRWAPRGAPIASEAPSVATWLLDAAALAAAELRAEAELGARPLTDDGRPVVLVIEGSRALNRALVGCFEPEYATKSAFHGESGLELALSLRPDLVIVDLDLPQMGGELVIHSLREHEEVDAAILAIAGSRDELQILRLLEAGVDDIIPKPVLLAELLARARRLLAAKKTQDVLSGTIGQRDTDLISLASEVADAHHGLERAYVDLEVARERAERMNEAKSNFLRIMSHELKTPVTAMKLQLRVLESDPEIMRNAALDRGLERIARSTRRLLDLVDTMLEWARVEDGRHRPELEPFDLADLAEEVAARLESHARVRQTELEVEHSQSRLREVVNDRRLVRLVMINLVERAISVSAEERVGIRLVESASGFGIHIRDSAPIMTEDQRAEVFDPVRRTRDFHRLSETGSGIGVYAIRDIARAVGGEIRWGDGGGSGNELVFHVPSHPLGAGRDVVPAGTHEVGWVPRCTAR
jgi:signal transduction histidine kinase